MIFKVFNFGDKKTGFFRINGYINENNLNILHDLYSKKEINIYAIQEKKMLKKILFRNFKVKKVSLIIQIRHIHIYAHIDDIYRIEILDDNGKIIDAINTHKEGVPKNIREEFDRQFRNEDGSDRIIPLEN